MNANDTKIVRVIEITGDTAPVPAAAQADNGVVSSRVTAGSGGNPPLVLQCFFRREASLPWLGMNIANAVLIETDTGICFRQDTNRTSF